jgi:hypothetical protein
MAIISGVKRSLQSGIIEHSDNADNSAALRRMAHARFLALATLMTVFFFNSVIVDTPLSLRFWRGELGHGMDASQYGMTTRDRMKDRFLLNEVPASAPIAASSVLAPHLANRDTLYLVRYPGDPGGQILPAILLRVEYVLADALFDYRLPSANGFDGGSPHELSEISLLLQEPDFGLVTVRDGLLLFQRGASGDAALLQEVEVDSRTSAPPQASFGAIELITSQITPISERWFRATFEWQTSGASEPMEQYFAVSQLEGVRDTRIVHLPTYALLPTTQWQPGQRVRETFDIELPADLAPGTYTWSVGWYDLWHSESYATDARSLLPGSQVVAVGEIVVDE